MASMKSRPSEKFVQPSELDFSKKSLLKVPLSVCQSDKLTVLDLSHNRLSSLPKEITGLHLLEKFTLRKNKFESIPRFVYQLQCLTHLDFGDNYISSVDDDIDELGGLMKLFLDNNQLSSLPEGFGRLVNMRTLDISGNHISEVPDCVTKLWAMRELRLGKNGIQNVTSELSNLDALEVLDVSDNKLTDVPEVLLEMKNLRQIDLKRNEIKKVPPELVNLKFLESIDLSENQIKTLPDEFCKIWSLKHVNLASNRVKELPGDFTYLEYLKILSLKENKLKQLPVDIDRFSSLTELYIDNNKIKSLPEALTNLQTLVILSATNNKISTFPPEIVNLANLRKLHLANNKLNNIAGDFANFVNLVEISLDHNKFRQFPADLTQVRQLNVLTLGYNKLKEIPTDIKYLTQLEELNIQNNKLLTSSFHNILLMGKIRKLNLSSNAMADIPGLFSVTLPKLEEFDISNNPFQEPLLKVSQSGIPAIRSYLLDRLDDVDDDPFFHDEMEDSRNIYLFPSDKVTKSYILPSGYKLEIPPGSVKKRKKLLSICDPNDTRRPPLKDYEFYQSDLLEFVPSGVVLSKPVRLVRQCPSVDSDRLVVVLKSDNGQNWTELPITCENDEVEVKVNKLSMFIAISRPRREQFTIDTTGTILTSETDDEVAIDIPQEAMRGTAPLNLEVHLQDPNVLENVFEDTGEPVNASFAPMVYVNREEKRSLHFQKPVVVNIPLPVDDKLKFPGDLFDDTKLCIVRDEYNDGEWEDITDGASFTVENDVVKLLRQNFSGHSVVRLRSRERSNAGGYCKAITKYKKSGLHKVKVLLLQHKGDKRKLLFDLVQQKGLDMQPLYKCIKAHRKNGYRSFYNDDVPYSEDIQIRSGDIVINEVNDEFVMKNKKRKKVFFPDQHNHWFAFVEPKTQENDKRDLTGFVSFYIESTECPKQQSKDAASNSNVSESEEGPLVELQFVLPKGTAESNEQSSSKMPHAQRERRKCFQYLCQKLMSHEWKWFARELLGEDAELVIDQVEHANPRDKNEQIYQMLLRWEETVDDSCVFISDLTEALERANLPWVVAEVKRRFPGHLKDESGTGDKSTSTTAKKS